MARILIVDDEEGICSVLSAFVMQMKHESTVAHTLEDGIKKALSESFDVVILDVRLPDGCGLNAIPTIRDARSSPEVIIITAAGDPGGAEMAIEYGAWDYIEKTASLHEMTLPVCRALQYRAEKKAKVRTLALKREQIIGDSPPMRHCLDLIAQAASSNASILITGETGTGKDLIARSIHENSTQAKGNFVVVDCSALPETLVESILFGHEKGAFTGAHSAQEGLILQANGGTLFLDEVGELPLNVQKAFLRVLQDCRFRPVGGTHEIKSSFRLVAATNKDLNKMVEAGQFRKDLLFRLRSLTIDVPSLRERRGDIREIALHHVSRLCDHYGYDRKEFPPEFLRALESYDWPGNVRELVHALEAALSAAGSHRTLFPKHLPIHIRIFAARASVKGNALDEECCSPSSTASPDPTRPMPSLRDFRTAAEKKYLSDLLSATQYDMRKAVAISGISQSRLYALLQRYGFSLKKYLPDRPQVSCPGNDLTSQPNSPLAID